MDILNINRLQENQILKIGELQKKIIEHETTKYKNGI